MLSFDTYTDDVVAAIERFGPGVVVVGHGMGGLLALKAAERHEIGGLVLLSAELPRDLRPPARPHELREIPEAYGKSLIGWETLPEKLQRDRRDLTLADVLRIQHLLGQKPHEAGAARRQMLAGVPVDRRAVAGVPKLVIGAGLDRQVPETDSERLAAWLDAPYEPFGAHSHYGLVVGEIASSRSPTRSARSSRPTDCRVAGVCPDRAVAGIIPAGPALDAGPRSRRRIRLEAQDTALSRRRSPVRIRYAVPIPPVLGPI